jgi:hypothetical protein
MAGNVGAFPVRFAGAATAERLVAPRGRIKGPHIVRISEGVQRRRDAARDGLSIILCMVRFVERKMIEFAMFLKIFVPERLVSPGFSLI